MFWSNFRRSTEQWYGHVAGRQRHIKCVLFDYFEPELEKHSPLSSLDQSSTMYAEIEIDFPVLFSDEDTNPGSESVHPPSPSSNHSLGDVDGDGDGDADTGNIDQVCIGICLDVSFLGDLMF